jgi:hypothetical protein
VIRIAIALVAAAALLVLVVLPAQYGIDPTGAGRLLGLTQMHATPRTVTIVDAVGGNERVREIPLPDFNEPVPLPNPAVHQDQPAAPVTRTLQVTLAPKQKTEIKAVLGAAKAMVYSWQVDQGQVYVDFHGHDPAAGDEFWVRYKEQDGATGGNGSLVAPFSGEHGWFWQNFGTVPIVISLTVTGYFADLVDYGILEDK